MVSKYWNPEPTIWELGEDRKAYLAKMDGSFPSHSVSPFIVSVTQSLFDLSSQNAFGYLRIDLLLESERMKVIFRLILRK